MLTRLTFHRIVAAFTIGVGTMLGGMVASRSLAAHGSEARLVRELAWKRPQITRALAANRSELGLSGSKVPAEVQAVGGRSCVVGPLVALDVDDAYAFDIDEPVDVTVTYAAEQTTPFAVAWDRNGGDGYGVSTEVKPEPGPGLHRVTLRLDRARFAGQGILKTDLAVGARGGTIALCDLELARSGTTSTPTTLGRLRLEVRDAQSRQTVPARVGLYDARGRTPLPSDDALSVHRYADEVRLLWVNRRTVWPSDHRQAFYVAGRYEASVPAGTYDLIVTRGPEYRAYRGKVEVRADQTTTATASLERYADLPASGWISGDSHVHLMRDRADDMNVWGQLAAEDVHVGHLLEMGNIGGTHFKQPAWGTAGRYGRDGYFLIAGQEDPRTGQRGHTIHWNVAQHTHAQEVFFQYHHVFERTRAAGAVTGYAHLGELFNGQRGLALDVPFGLVDFIEVLQGGRLNSQIWYRFLNLGYRVLPVAGADFPYFGPTLPGVERTYVKVDGPVTPDSWLSAFRQGHAYVTNGPFLEFTVNGRQMGEEIRVPRGARLEIAAAARLNPDVDVLDRLELVALGDVVMAEPARGQDRVGLRKELVADRSMWLAVRVYGRRQEAQFNTIAHSAPIYVVVDDQPTWKREAVTELVAYHRAQLEQLLTIPVDPNQDLETWETREVLVEEWKRQLPQLRPRVEEANRRYDQLLERFRSSSHP
jgi:hypothetical protein